MYKFWFWESFDLTELFIFNTDPYNCFKCSNRTLLNNICISKENCVPCPWKQHCCFFRLINKFMCFCWEKKLKRISSIRWTDAFICLFLFVNGAFMWNCMTFCDDISVIRVVLKCSRWNCFTKLISIKGYIMIVVFDTKPKLVVNAVWHSRYPTSNSESRAIEM